MRIACTLSRRGFIVELREWRMRQPKQLVNDSQRLDDEEEFDERFAGVKLSVLPSSAPLCSRGGDGIDVLAYGEDE